jgi:XTP/dITP diphosphohydrolase
MQGRIVFATGNAGKIKEIRMIMEDTGMEVVSMKMRGLWQILTRTEKPTRKML